MHPPDDQRDGNYPVQLPGSRLQPEGTPNGGRVDAAVCVPPGRDDSGTRAGTLPSGWPSETDEVDVFTVQTQQQRAAPFADRVRRMDGLLPYLPTKVPEGDSPVEPRDLPSEKPILDAREGNLTTFETRLWVPAHRRGAPGSTAASSSKAATEAAKDPAKDA